MESPNSLFLEYLHQLKLEAESKGKIKIASNYKKCIRSLLLYPLPLRTTAEAGILDGFGDKICEDLNKHLKSHAKDLNLEPSAVLEYSRNIPPEWWPISESFQHQNTKAPKAKRPKPARPVDEQINQIPMEIGVKGSGAVVLHCDKREVNGSGKGKKELLKNLKNLKSFSVEYTVLNISDFCFLKDGRVKILIERKRIDDLASSIKDKRYREQKKRLNDVARTRPFYLIEHKAYHGVLSLRAIHQAIANIFWINECHVIFTSSITDTFKTLKFIGENLGESVSVAETDLSLPELNDISNRRKRVTKEVQLCRMLQSIHGMTPHFASRLSASFGTFHKLAEYINKEVAMQGDLNRVSFLPKHLRTALTIFFTS